MMNFITALLYFQQSDMNMAVQKFAKIFSEREKNIAIENRRRQIQRDRKRIDKSNGLREKYAREKENLLEYFNNTAKNITKITKYPEEISPDYFLTLEDYNEVAAARNNFIAALETFERKKNRRAFFLRACCFVLYIAFILCVSFLNGK